jgi:hypothetical protein
MFTPFAFVKSGVTGPPAPVVPTSGLVAWYDASDYTSGATWTDRSSNGYDLTLNNTFSKVTSPITAVFFNGGFGNVSSVTDWSATTDITHIEILRPTVVSSFIGTFAVQGTNGLGSFQLDGTGRIYTWKNGDTGWYLTTQTYNTAKTAFIARRCSSGFNNTGDTLIVDYADSSAVSLTKYGSGNFALGRGGSTAYTIGGSASLGVGTIDVTAGLTYDMAGYYGVNLFYNRILTDQEITDIYDYYKSTYSLL